MISKQEVFVNDQTGHTIVGLTPVSGGVVIGSPVFHADMDVPVQVGPQTLSVTVRTPLAGDTPEDAFAAVPAAYKAHAMPEAVKAVEKQIQAQKEAEAKKVLLAGAGEIPPRLNGHGRGHGADLRLRR